MKRKDVLRLAGYRLRIVLPLHRLSGIHILTLKGHQNVEGDWNWNVLRGRGVLVEELVADTVPMTMPLHHSVGVTEGKRGAIQVEATIANSDSMNPAAGISNEAIVYY